MTLLTVIQAACLDVGVESPSAVASSTEREYQEFLSFANVVAADIARRVDWSDLTTSATLTGDGTDLAHSLPSGFDRLIKGRPIVASGAIVRPLTQAEWTMTAVQGTPRYFLLSTTTVKLYPYLADAATATAHYQTKNWCSNGTALFTADSDTAKFPEAVLQKGVIAHWRRQKGMPYQDQEAEFEAALLQYADFNDRRGF